MSTIEGFQTRKRLVRKNLFILVVVKMCRNSAITIPSYYGVGTRVTLWKAAGANLVGTSATRASGVRGERGGLHTRGSSFVRTSYLEERRTQSALGTC